MFQRGDAVTSAEGLSAAGANFRSMLLSLCAAALVFTLALYAVGRASLRIMRRLELDPVAVMLWLGLAEEVITPRRRRQRLGQLG